MSEFCAGTNRQALGRSFARWRVATLVKRNESLSTENGKLKQALEQAEREKLSLANEKSSLEYVSLKNDQKLRSENESAELLSSIRKMLAEVQRGAKQSTMAQDLTLAEDDGNSSGVLKLGQLLRTYQSKIQRLQSEVSNYQLLWLSETAKRLEKEVASCTLQKEIENISGENTSLKLKIARSQVNIDDDQSDEISPNDQCIQQ